MKAYTLGELAYEENDSGSRTSLWKTALNSLEGVLRRGVEPSVAVALGSLAVDCYQDRLSDLSFAERLLRLRTSRDFINQALPSSEAFEKTALLLARKSSILRHLSLADYRVGSAGQTTKKESVASADRSVQLSRQAATLLELGLSTWEQARWESTDDKYLEKVDNAELILTDNLLKDYELAKLAKARFYRLTFRQLEACEAFSHSIERVKDVRRLLRDSYIYAEAAIQLWYADFPKEFVTHHLLEARKLLETAISAGYTNARLVTGLAYTNAVLDGPAAGSTVLNDLLVEGTRISWIEALDLASKADVVDLSDPVSAGLALGINQSAVWSTLGTYVLKFQQEYDLSEAMYKTDIRLDPHNPISLSNLARLLIRDDAVENLKEAERLLQRAQAFADRRFTWWRVVHASLLRKKTELGLKQTPKVRERESLPEPPPQYVNLNQLKSRFKVIEQLNDAQKRGYELESLFYEMAHLNRGDCFSIL